MSTRLLMAVTHAIVHARTDSTVSLVLTGRHLDVTGTDLNLPFPPWPPPAMPSRKTSACRPGSGCTPGWADRMVAAAWRETRHAAVCLIITTP